MKKLAARLILIGILLVGLSALAGFFWWRGSLSAPDVGSVQKITFNVNQGETGQQVISNLEKQKLIKSALAAKIYARLNPSASNFKPGVYNLSADTDLAGQFAILGKGPNDIKVTFPEGWRREQVAVRLAVLLAGTNSPFDMSEFIRETNGLEGQIFPDTYYVSSQATTKEIIKMFTDNFNRQVATLPGYSRDVLVMASLLERESSGKGDRGVIAGILLKRLREDWPLQVDASVQFARDAAACSDSLNTCKWWQPVVDTKLPSSFNTYLNPGLPPGPICNPGLASIKAVLEPVETEYWFYIHAPDGTTYYAATMAQHNLNIDKHLRP